MVTQPFFRLVKVKLWYEMSIGIWNLLACPIPKSDTTNIITKIICTQTMKFLYHSWFRFGWYADECVTRLNSKHNQKNKKFSRFCSLFFHNFHTKHSQVHINDYWFARIVSVQLSVCACVCWVPVIFAIHLFAFVCWWLFLWLLEYTGRIKLK